MYHFCHIKKVICDSIGENCSLCASAFSSSLGKAWAEYKWLAKLACASVCTLVICIIWTSCFDSVTCMERLVSRTCLKMVCHMAADTHLLTYTWPKCLVCVKSVITSVLVAWILLLRMILLSWAFAVWNLFWNDAKKDSEAIQNDSGF